MGKWARVSSLMTSSVSDTGHVCLDGRCMCKSDMADLLPAADEPTSKKKRRPPPLATKLDWPCLRIPAYLRIVFVVGNQECLKRINSRAISLISQLQAARGTSRSGDRTADRTHHPNFHCFEKNQLFDLTPDLARSWVLPGESS